MKRRSVSPARQRGMSLVELMVGLTVGLILVAGLALMFANASRSSSELDKSVRQIENGRYAIELLSQDLMMAGYFDAAPVTAMSAVTSGGVTAPCLDSTALKAKLDTMRTASPPTLPFGVEGLTPVQAAAQAAAAPTCMPNYRAGTPALVLRRLEPTPIAASSVTAGTLYMQDSRNSADSNRSTYMVSDSSSDFNDYHDMNGNVNTVRRMITRIYYIASCDVCGTGGDSIPTLKYAQLNGASFTIVPLAEGIEQIGFDYAFDTDGDGAPDEWYGLNGAADAVQSTYAAARGWGNVMAVKVSLVARNTESTAGFTDNRSYAAGLNGTTDYSFTPTGTDTAYKRRDYVSAIRLISVAGQRELP